ncbi:hypothetical protein B0H13DRAFT_2273169 [Mycena leptocephala]|nr:hypothetical protein B0H13DRAFT_2273169 [Mycena leptocephala]
MDGFNGEDMSDLLHPQVQNFYANSASPNAQVDLIERWRGYLVKAKASDAWSWYDSSYDGLEERWKWNLKQEAEFYAPLRPGYDEQAIRCWDDVLETIQQAWSDYKDLQDSGCLVVLARSLRSLKIIVQPASLVEEELKKSAVYPLCRIIPFRIFVVLSPFLFVIWRHPRIASFHVKMLKPQLPSLSNEEQDTIASLCEDTLFAAWNEDSALEDINYKLRQLWETALRIGLAHGQEEVKAVCRKEDHLARAAVAKKMEQERVWGYDVGWKLCSEVLQDLVQKASTTTLSTPSHSLGSSHFLSTSLVDATFPARFLSALYGYLAAFC